MSTTTFHNLSADDVLASVNSSAQGLATDEAARRLAEHGANALPQKRRASRLQVLLNQIKSPLIYILIIAGALKLALRDMLDASVIFTAVFVNSVIGYFQENKAENALEKLHNFISYHATALRDNEKTRLDSRDLVVGDIVFLDAGDRVPADGRLLRINDLEVNEASLTGESVPVAKSINSVDVGALVGDRTNMVHMGTVVTKGHGLFVVTGTGLHTELGEVAGLINETQEEPTPLQRRMERFGRLLSMAVLGIAIFIVLEGLWRSFDLLEIFEIAVAVAVASIPEGLVVSITVILTLGMQRILKEKALVRRLVATETLGSTSIICSDKTGTLTQGSMAVSHIVLGSSAKDALTLTKGGAATIHDYDDLKRAIEIALLANDAEILREDGEVKEVGDPTETALLHVAPEYQMDYNKIRVAYPRLDDIPFDSEAKFMASLHEFDAEHNIVMIKGAPEVLLELSSFHHRQTAKKALSAARKEYVLTRNDELTEQGLRVLAVAYKLVPKSTTKLSEQQLKALVYTGLFAMEDPLREESKSTLKYTQAAGIRTVIITGDHKKTVATIARQLGFVITDTNIIEGRELDGWTDEELRERVRDIDVYARVSPRHKIRIVNAWQSHGEVVAMLGDGVNDAPALKAADIGVAVGSGTDVAKETSDIVLLDDNFKTIVMAIKQGRIIFDNIRKVTLYLLVDSFAEVVLVVGALALGYPIPITATQILFVNIMSDGFPHLALAFEPGERDIMKRKPRPKNEGILDKELKFLIFIVGLVTDIGLFGIFFYLFEQGYAIEHIRTIIFMALAFNSLLFVFSVKSLNKPLWKIDFFNNPYIFVAVALGIAVQLGAYFTPLVHNALGLVWLTRADWLLILAAASLKIIAIEIGKVFFYTKPYENTTTS